jgi:hypothetical protein
MLIRGSVIKSKLMGQMKFSGVSTSVLVESSIIIVSRLLLCLSADISFAVVRALGENNEPIK